uniref:DUF5682 family protein n=1 Tax=Nocardia donostiensis TaxID=1538463 RepID=UPI001FE939AA|nr:DUF5682 family protein [Nocardia donostiensis]
MNTSAAAPTVGPTEAAPYAHLFAGTPDARSTPPELTGPQTRVFGIRHHGPGSARSLRLALTEFRPDAILIEGPADADPLVAFVGAEGMRPPVALLAYVPDEPARAAFWPFAAFSPEWQALRYAVEHDIPVHFCDLPAGNVLAADDPPGTGDPLSELAAAAGYDDAERWWDAVVESSTDADIFTAITEAMSALREAGTEACLSTSPLSPVPPTAPPDGNRGNERNEPTGHKPEIDTAGNAEADPTDRNTNGTTTAASTNNNARGTATNGVRSIADVSPQQPLWRAAEALVAFGSSRADSSAPQVAVHQPPSGSTGGDTKAAQAATSTPTDPDQDASTTASDNTAGATATTADVEAAGTAWSTPGIDAHTLRREAYMRQVLRKTLKAGAQRVAVVCGAWHAPALAGPLGPTAADTRLLKGMPKVKARTTWVPWTHSRLTSASGYGAGVTSPGWYHHLFVQPEQPVAAWLTKVATVLRRHDLPVSSAHIIESVRLAESLATLRGRPLAGLSEVTEATRAVLCEGDETMLRLIGAELVVGEELGAVPERVPAVALDVDLRAQLRSLRMKLDPLMRTVDLDLRKERDIAKSRLLHRLRLLDVAWGTRTDSEVRSTGTFRETWTLQWRPEFAVAVIEAARWGTTVRGAAEAKILDTASRDDSGVGDLTDALELALLADLGGATDGLIARLASAAAVDHDVSHLLTALPGLVRTLRYGDVRGTDTAALTQVADGMLVRICAGLPAAVTGLGADAALELRALLDTAHTAILTRDNEQATDTWLSALRRLADRGDVHGALTGRVVRLLSDAGVIEPGDSALRLSAALSVGSSAADKAAWIDGFVGGRGLLLVHDRGLLRLVDDWLTTLTDDQFVETLPLLRRTFGAFESGERRAIGRAVRAGGPTRASTAATGLDLARGELAMRVVAEILGVAV